MTAGVIARVLIAVDDSTESLAAARTGAALAAGWNASLRLVNVAAPGRNAEGRRLLDYVARAARSSGVPSERIETVVREGQPFRSILEEARTWNADLIVMAVSNRIGLRSPYVGSATEHVLEFAECPVLVVPPAAERRP